MRSILLGRHQLQTEQISRAVGLFGHLMDQLAIFGKLMFFRTLPAVERLSVK